jgi:hypothetical protein
LKTNNCGAGQELDIISPIKYWFSEDTQNKTRKEVKIKQQVLAGASLFGPLCSPCGRALSPPCQWAQPEWPPCCEWCSRSHSTWTERNVTGFALRRSKNLPSGNRVSSVSFYKLVFHCFLKNAKRSFSPRRKPKEINMYLFT